MAEITFTYERKFGSQGSGNGQFLNPHDISFDAAGNVFVCDRDRNDIQKFTNAGVYVSKFGSSGSGNGQFNVPYAIQHDPTHAFIYVADRENNRVQKIDAVTGAYISKITTVNGRSLDKPEDITFDKTTGDMYITDTGNDRIVKLDKNHNFILQWGKTGSGNGEFEHPHSINTDSVGNVFISCGDQPYIQKFTPVGVFVKKFGSEGTGPGQTQMFLEHMDIDIFGYVHLINNDSRPIINVWNTNGDWITQYGNTSSGSANGQFKEPEHVTCDPSNGKPFVVDCKNFRIQVFSVSVTPTTPPPVVPPTTGGAPLSPDSVFGIKRFFPTKTNGREWYSNWHLATTTDHTWASTGILNSNRDPQDTLVDIHANTGNRATVTQATGIMLAGEEGAADNNWRLYINDPLLVWKWDPSVEMTVYYKALGGPYTGGTIFVHARLAGPTEHQLESICNASGHGYSFEIKQNGVVQIRKEMMHDAYADNIVATGYVGGQIGLWIGMKLILLVQPNGDVLIRCYIDRADGVGGGVWELVLEHLDTGDMVMTSETEIAKFNGRNTTGGPDCAGVDTITERLNFPASSCYLRMDNVPIEFKKFSIREIVQGAADAPGTDTGVLTNSDIVVRLSGGSGNIDPNESKGGIESTTSVELNNILHNLFSDFPPDQLGPGTTKYRLVYIHNNSNTSVMKNVMVFVLVDSESLDTALFYGKAVAPIGQYETVIVNETDAPPGVSFQFGDTISTGINLGDLPPQGFKGLWLKLVCEPGADNFPEDKAFIRIVADPGTASNLPGGGTGGGTGGGGTTTPPDEPPVQTTPSYSFVVVGDLGTSADAKKNITKMKGRNPALIFINGDVIYADNANSLKSELGTDWVAKTKISLGNHDVDESESQPSAKNSLKSTFSMPADYYTFTLNNMFGVVMNSEISNSTTSNQYKDLKPKLEAAAANSAIEWIFVFNHRPIYGDKSGHHPNNENNEIQNWHSVWDANKVIAVWQSHNHDLFRTRPLKKGSSITPIVTSTATTEYVNPEGEFFIGTGGGGRSHYSFGSPADYTVFDDDSHYGYWVVDIFTSPRKAVFRCFSNSDVLLHTFTVIRGGASKYNIVTMTALGFDGSTVPPNADDDSMDTMWQHTANPTWIQADLGATKVCSFVDIAWNGSDAALPKYTFNIEYSTNGTSWTPIINDRQNTTNLALERYTFPGSVNARYIRVNIKGNTVDSKAAILELDVGRLT